MQQMERTWRLEQVDANVSVDGLSFEDLFAEQHARLYRACNLIVGNGHEAEELMQDAFVKVLERWDRQSRRLPVSVCPELDTQPLPAAAVVGQANPLPW
jgi:hypothetical protein